jgi:hypothetical protein
MYLGEWTIVDPDAALTSFGLASRTVSRHLHLQPFYKYLHDTAKYFAPLYHNLLTRAS